MDGRLYDPALGRFVSADPYVSDPATGQGWNRYAYVSNSPLSPKPMENKRPRHVYRSYEPESCPMLHGNA